MKVEIERFFASLAVSAVCLAGCTVETTTSGLGTSSSSTTGATGGTGTSSSTASTTSSTTGAGGAGNDASTGTGGAPTDGGGDVSTPGDGGACFPDDTNAGDAGVSPCSSLPYANVNCGDDAMAEPPLGAFICEDLEGDLKIAAFRELYDCLKAVPGADGGADDACSMAHETAASACSVQLFSRTTCSVPPSTVDGGALGCAQIVASCPGDGGVGGITLGDCQRFLAPFNDPAREFIVSCYFDPAMPQGTSCADKFENVCVFPAP